MAVWTFRRHRPDEKIRNPIQGEFFSEEAVEAPAQALVREVIQNSLDARAGSEPVHVRFGVSPEEGLTTEAAHFWFGGAWPHLRAEGNGLRGVPPEPGACRFLTIEDFGTTGLDGDPAECRPSSHPGRLFAFFRAEGVSQKGGKDAGRWGVGKTVFPRSSDFNSFLCLTIRRDDSRQLLFGQSVLRYHWLGDEYYSPDGAFGLSGREGVRPTEDVSLLARLRNDFALARRDEPGLTVIVPWATTELTGEAILNAVLREYFYPILSGQLVVTIDDTQLPGGPKKLDDELLLEELLHLKGPLKDTVSPLAALTLWLNREGFAKATPLCMPPTRSPDWSPEMVPAEDRLRLSETYRAGKEICLKVPLEVHPVEGESKATFFHVALKRDAESRGAAPVFVRNGIQIPKALERRVRGQSLWALVIIEDQPLATLLGDAETPAHTHWSKDTQNFRKKYRYGAATIDFVRSTPRVLAELFADTGRERDVRSLADIFPMPSPVEAARAVPGRRLEPAGDTGDGLVPEVAGAGEGLRVERLAGGFRISPGVARAVPAGFAIRVAYDSTRGNALRKYHPSDFDLAALGVRLEGLTPERCRGNELVVRRDRPQFRLEVGGFDPNRDLVLKVEPWEPERDPEA